MRLFYGYRPNPPEGYKESGLANEADQPQYQGVRFDDGTVALKWMTAVHSTSLFDSFGDFLKVHGHPEYGTRIEWRTVNYIYDELSTTDDIDDADEF